MSNQPSSHSQASAAETSDGRQPSVKSWGKRGLGRLLDRSSKYSIAQILRWLWGAWRGNRLQAMLNAMIGLVSVGVSLAQVWAVQHAIDVASGVRAGSVYWAVAIMGTLILCDFALNISSVWVRNILGIRAQNRMQQRMLDRILRSEWHGKETHHSGDVLNRLEFDVTNVVNFLTEVIPNTLSVLALFVGAFVYLFLMDATLALITVAIIPVFVLLSKVYIGHMRRLTREVRNSDSKVQSVLQETIQNRMLIKTLESERPMVGRLEHTQGELRHKVVKRTVFSVFSNLILNFGFALGYLVAFLWAALRMSQHSLTFGGMTAFLQLVNKIQSPARDLTKLVPAFVSVLTATERLMELEENPLEEQGAPIKLNVPCGVRLSDVSYRYDDVDGDVIQHLNFDFRPGSCTAILGETGSGKTTLVRLILALLAPQSGKVEIYDNRGARTLTPRMRCNFVYVPQGNTLMSGTIRDNLRLGKLSATDDEMREALHCSCADFVMDLPDGLDTVCAESGGGLSEGQAQRIAIARALLRNRSIMLFDEATSALDPETERQLLHNVLASHDKTVIFITHRPAVVDYCDQTLKIEKI
ncbi:MAG: ABC transporter ATP-binding protein [Prevotella sp.]|nr:ABC transporter ATP-binding protein [Prevotella sp.]